MIIVHPIDNFIYELFPNIEKNIESLEKAFRKFYTVENIEPQIDISTDFIKITIDTERIEIESSVCTISGNCCNKGMRFNPSLTLLIINHIIVAKISGVNKLFPSTSAVTTPTNTITICDACLKALSFL